MIRPLLLLLLLCGANAAAAATVRKVSKDKTKILLGLSKAEMAPLEEAAAVIVELSAGGERFVVTGKLAKLNPLKQTVVLELERPDERLARKATARFLSVFWNAALAREVVSVAQYHQYAHPFAEAAAGYFYGKSRSRIDAAGLKDETTVSGTRFAADAYVILDANWAGVSFGFDRIDALRAVSTTVGSLGSAESTASSETTLKPALWLGLPDNYRLGLEYDYTLAHQSRGGGASEVSFDFYVAQPYVSVVHVQPDAEIGLGGRLGDRAAATDTATDGGVVRKENSVFRAPGEVLAFYRRVSSPAFVWGVSGGVVFAERNSGDGAPLDRRFEAHETLHARASFERRLGDGSKFDWGLFYAGAKTRSEMAGELGLNGGGVDLGYQTLVGGELVLGGQLELFGGALRSHVAAVDQNGQASRVGRKAGGASADALLFARMDFDFGAAAKGRRLAP